MQDRSYWRLIRDPGFSWMLASQFLGGFNVNVYTWAITFYALDLASRPDAPFQAPSGPALSRRVSDPRGTVATRL